MTEHTEAIDRRPNLWIMDLREGLITDRIPIALAEILAPKGLGISVCCYDDEPDGPVKKDDGRLTAISFSSLNGRSIFFTVCETPEYKTLMWSLRPRSFRDSVIDETAIQAADAEARELLEPVVNRILTSA